MATGRVCAVVTATRTVDGSSLVRFSETLLERNQVRTHGFYVVSTPGDEEFWIAGFWQLGQVPLGPPGDEESWIAGYWQLG